MIFLFLLALREEGRKLGGRVTLPLRILALQCTTTSALRCTTSSTAIRCNSTPRPLDAPRGGAFQRYPDHWCQLVILLAVDHHVLNLDSAAPRVSKWGSRLPGQGFRQPHRSEACGVPRRTRDRKQSTLVIPIWNPWSLKP